ncbi:hypothetical protein [Bacillus subtilis]|uniref:hypothetical protein n=1 Tax=Bacillus subtilis TaxID=1423 RepID=UPI00137485BA|nr:hypothetical protein [Bacillus subtilis]QHQ82204.1 hypothetical protein GPJ55_22195 [Bacillus subtilis]
MSDQPVYIKKKQTYVTYTLMLFSVMACFLLASCSDNKASSGMNDREEDELVYAELTVRKCLKKH